MECHNQEHPNHGVGPGTGSSHRFDECKEDFKKAWHEKQPYEEIIKKFKISYGTVYNWAKLLNLSRRTKEDIIKSMEIKENKIELMSDEFKEQLAHILLELDAEKVTLDDAKELYKNLIRHIKKLEQVRGGFIHEFVTLKSKGRVVIPDSLRAAIGAVEGTRFDAHLFPNPEKPRGIALIKER